MDRDRFHIPGALWVERQRHRDGPDCYVVWRPETSVLAADRKAVLNAARWPASTPTGQALREWLNSHITTETNGGSERTEHSDAAVQ